MRHDRRTLLAGLAVVAVSACNGTKDRRVAAGDTAAPQTAVRDSAAGVTARDSTGPDVSHDGWTDAQIVAYAAATNEDEIAEGRLAAHKAVNAQVKAFARALQSDHEALLREGRHFASEHKITPDTTKSDVADAMKDSRDELKDLTDKKAGADWDQAFLDKQIDGHKQVLGKLQDAAKATTDPALQKMLTTASGKVQEHLTRAQALKEKYPKG